MKKRNPFRKLFDNFLKRTFLIMLNAVFLMIPGIMKAYAIDTWSQKTMLSPDLSESELTNDPENIIVPVYLTKSTGEVITQQVTVTGTVRDHQSGDVMPGVNVLVKGTSLGTITNGEGKYTINVSDRNSTLIFSFIGYVTQEISLNGRATLDVALLSDVEQLGEVVVIGYGTQRMEEITGSVTTTSSAQLASIPALTTSGALKGLMSGVTVTKSHGPGDEAVIRIRGLGTINNNDPLWVVDGVPGLSVPSEEIESVTILKDAASQAIYGARAANGVILVTTKSGRKNQKTRINITTRNGYSQNTNNFGLLNTQEYGEYLWLRAKNSGISNFSHALYGNGAKPDIPEYILPARATSVDLSLYDYQMIPEDGDDTYLIMKANKDGTDWLDEITRNANYQQYTLDVTGGGQNTRYAFMANYIGQKGILKQTGTTRYTMRSNLSADLTNWLEVGGSIGASFINDYGLQNDHSEGSIISFSYRMQPIVPVYDVMGNFAGSRAPETGNARSPAFMLYGGRNDYRKTMGINGNFHVKANLLKDIKFQSLIGFNLNSLAGKQFSMVEVATSERGTYDQLSQSSSTSYLWNWTNTIEYDKVFGQHDLNILLGTEAVASEYNSLGGSRQQFFSKDPNYMQLSVGEREITNSGNMSEWSLFSQFGRLNYNFLNRYFLQATVRRDGSSRFGEENRWGIFPSFSAGWTISEESFMLFSDNWLDKLRIRIGWGQTGNDQVGNYNGFTLFASSPTNSYYPITGSNTTPSSGFYASAIGNTNAKWETTTTTNLGFDVTLLKNLSFTIDLWQRKTNDMLYQKSIPQVLGLASAPSVNVGDMSNKGIDFEVKYYGSLLNQNFQYNVALNVSHYQNEIVNLSGRETDFLQGAELRSYYYTRATTGTAYPVFFGYIVDGIFQTSEEAAAHPPAFGATGTYNKAGTFKYRDVNDDKVINDADRTIIGSPHPDFTAGLTINLDYKHFNLSGILFSSVGNDVVNQTRRFIDFNLFSGNRSKRSLYQSWGSPYLKNNEDAIMPMVVNDDAGSQYPSTYYVEKGSYLRMENLLLGYDFVNFIKNPVVQKLQAFVQVTNLFTLTGYSGLDPEIGRGGMNSGVDAGAWPTPRQFLIGIDVGF